MLGCHMCLCQALFTCLSATYTSLGIKFYNYVLTKNSNWPPFFLFLCIYYLQLGLLFLPQNEVLHKNLRVSLLLGFSTNKLGFTPEFLGRVKLVTSVASLLGVGLYNSFLKAVPLRKIFLLTTIIGSTLGMTQVLVVYSLLSKKWFCYISVL